MATATLRERITEALTGSTRERALEEVNEQLARLEAECPYRENIVPDGVTNARLADYEGRRAKLRMRRTKILQGDHDA